MKVLITGGAGFIGSHLAAHFQRRAEVRVLDNLRTGHAHNLAGLDVEFLHGSILDRELVARAVRGVDYVFHLAAFVSVPESVERPHECVALNVTGLLNVLEAAAAAGVRKLVFSSSAAIYGDNPDVPKYEDMRPEPRSPYAVTKLDGEYYCQHYTEAHGLETAALRFFNVFGPRQDPAGAYAAAVPIFMQRALAGEPLTIFGDGGQTRDFIYVADVVDALLRAMGQETPGASVFNVCTGKTTSLLELAAAIGRVFGQTPQIAFGATRVGDIRESLGNPAEARRGLGFSAKLSIAEGLGLMAAYEAK